MAALPDWYEKTLALQLTMNPKTWAELQEHGVDESSQLRLDFFYDAPGEREAQSLTAFLRAETDYDVTADGSQEQWSVTGTTQPTAVSLEILNQWVDWMVTAGAEHACEFDGWGAVAE
jgi:hypothetical protein